MISLGLHGGGPGVGGVGAPRYTPGLYGQGRSLGTFGHSHYTSELLRGVSEGVWGFLLYL